MSHIDPVIYDIYHALCMHPDTMIVDNGADGCWLTSHIARGLMLERELTPFEITIKKADGNQDPYVRPRMANATGEKFNQRCVMAWESHFVAACEMGEDFVIFDPLLFEGPAFLKEYNDLSSRYDVSY